MSAIIVMMQGPDGVGLDYMDRQSAKAEALLTPLRARGDVTNVLSIVGRWDLNRNYLIAPLVPWSERSRSQQEIASELRAGLKAIPGATARIRTPNSLNLRRAGGSLEFALTGARYEDIAVAADAFLEAMHRRAPELEDPNLVLPSLPVARTHRLRVVVIDYHIPGPKHRVRFGVRGCARTHENETPGKGRDPRSTHGFLRRVVDRHVSLSKRCGQRRLIAQKVAVDESCARSARLTE